MTKRFYRMPRPHRAILRIVCFAVATIATLSYLPQARAAATAETGFGALFASLAADAICLHGNEGDLDVCKEIALAVDPPASPGITSITISIAYNQSKFTFDPLLSGFLCQFSINGDCPAANAAVGTFPLTVLPPPGVTPGQPLPASSETLTDTGSVVTLAYAPSTAVVAETETNFFLFVFAFKNPPLISVPLSTVTYLNSGPGLDFTQSSFVCKTTVIPDQGCGSFDEVAGITLNLVPEPAALALLCGGLVVLLAGGRRRGRAA